MKIGDMSNLFNIPRETIRFYEREGLMLAPNRNNNNYRSYGKNHIERLRFIKNCRYFNMSHREIKKLLDLIDNNKDNCTLVDHVIDSHLSKIRENINNLKKLEKDLITLQKHSNKTEPDNKCKTIKSLLSIDI